MAGLPDLDAALFALVNGAHHPLLDTVMALLSRKALAVLPALALALVLFRAHGRQAWLLAAAALLAVGLSDLAAGQVKALAERVRPCHAVAQARVLVGCTGSFALPSSHATNMAALAGVATAGSPLAGAALGLLAVAVGYSRVYLGVHYPGDVLAGLLLGGVVGGGIGWASRRLAARLARPGAAASWSPASPPRG
jgi:undecaprenyl-diphosphatase